MRVKECGCNQRSSGHFQARSPTRVREAACYTHFASRAPGRVAPCELKSCERWRARSCRRMAGPPCGLKRNRMLASSQKVGTDEPPHAG